MLAFRPVSRSAPEFAPHFRLRHTSCFSSIRSTETNPRQEPIMTPNTKTARIAKLTGTARVEQLLRDAAFVLKMTRRVKEEILRDAAELKTASRSAEQHPAPALGV
jgi:hypothetical protein